MNQILDIADAPRFIQGILNAVNKPQAQPALKAWLAEFQQDIAEGFEGEREQSGQSWLPWFFRALWAPNDHKTLHVSGKLESSVTESGAEGNITEIGDDYVVTGSDLPYAGIQQRGATFVLGIDLIGRNGGFFKPKGSRITIPARPFLEITEEQTTRAGELVMAHLRNTIGQAA